MLENEHSLIDNLTWKIGLILCMINRAKPICSNEKLFDTEIKKLRSLFYDNGYPNCFGKKFHHPHATQNDDVPVSEKLILFDVPYVGKPYYRFYKNISKMILKASDVKFRPIYTVESLKSKTILN